MQFTPTVATDRNQCNAVFFRESEEAPQAPEKAIDEEGTGVDQAFCILPGVKSGSEMLLENIQVMPERIAVQFGIFPAARGLGEFFQELASGTSLFISPPQCGSDHTEHVKKPAGAGFKFDPG